MDAPLKFSSQGASQLRPGASLEEPFAVSEIIEQLTGFVRRQFPIFVFVIGCSVALGLIYLVTTPAKYTSHAMLLIDSSKLRILQQQQTPIGDVPIDTAQVETQVEILKSENIGLSVIKELKLTDDTEFANSSGGILGFLRHMLDGEQSETALSRAALAAFIAKRTVTRVGRTYVLDIGFTSLDRARSAAIANAIADAYIVDQLEAKYQATKRASSWLQDRIKELRQQASEADRAVLDYKEKNKIVAVGGNSSGGPRLLGEQQLEDLNTQLGTARAAAEETKARLERINEVMRRDVPDAAVADSLHSDVINRLRNNYLDIAAKEAIWSARYGSGHLAALNLRTQMAELRRAIFDELGRIAQSYKSDYEIAKTRVDGLERELQRLVASSQVTNRDRLGLSDLESSAKVYHSIYDNFLQRYMEAIQQQSFPITEARVISSARLPDTKSGPLPVQVLGLAALMGVIFSFSAAVLREAADRVFRTTRQVENALQTHCLAVLPRLNSSKAVGDQAPSGEVRREGWKPSKPLPVSAGERAIDRSNGLLRQVVTDPLSSFAEAFRSIKIAADIGGDPQGRVIGITSTLPGEGKSTVAANLAELIAHAGNRVILLDGDLRNPSLTRSLASRAGPGLLEVITKSVDLKEATYSDPGTGLTFLPTIVPSDTVHTNEILASASMRAVVDSLRNLYDYVVIDLPPMAPIVDVRATTRLVDSYIYVIEWGKTRVDLAQHQLQVAPEIHDRLLGAVLNKAEVGVLERYEGHYRKSYHYGQYGYKSD